jgi:hypothetical protein
MESRTCRDVHIDVSMMHTVHAPQDRHGVKHDMLQVDGEVQQQDRDGDRQPGWNRADRMEQPPTPLLSDHGHAHRRQRKRHANEEGVERHQGHVSRPSPATDDQPGTPRD